MIYTDSKIGTVAFNMESNTKPCKIRPAKLDNLEFHTSRNMDENKEKPWENKENDEEPVI